MCYIHQVTHHRLLPIFPSVHTLLFPSCSTESERGFSLEQKNGKTKDRTFSRSVFWKAFPKYVLKKKHSQKAFSRNPFIKASLENVSKNLSLLWRPASVSSSCCYVTVCIGVCTWVILGGRYLISLELLVFHGSVGVVFLCRFGSASAATQIGFVEEFSK